MLSFRKVPDMRKVHPELKSEGELAYAGHMQVREDAFRAVFGQSYPDDHILSPIDANLMVNWPGGGIFQYPPSRGWIGWHYVTHGLTQPPEPTMEPAQSPEAVSGWGIELVISTPVECGWAPEVLLNLVRYLLFQPNSRPILPHHRLPCNGPLVLGSDTKLNHLLGTLSSEYENELVLPAGRCDLVHLVGVTQQEIDQAKAWGLGDGGSRILEEVLRRMGVGVLSDPSRACLTEHPQFEEVWTQVRSELETKWRGNG